MIVSWHSYFVYISNPLCLCDYVPLSPSVSAHAFCVRLRVSLRVRANKEENGADHACDASVSENIL